MLTPKPETAALGDDLRKAIEVLSQRGTYGETLTAAAGRAELARLLDVVEAADATIERAQRLACWNTSHRQCNASMALEVSALRSDYRVACAKLGV